MIPPKMRRRPRDETDYNALSLQGMRELLPEVGQRLHRRDYDRRDSSGTEMSLLRRHGAFRGGGESLAGVAQFRKERNP